MGLILAVLMKIMLSDVPKIVLMMPQIVSSCEIKGNKIVLITLLESIDQVSLISRYQFCADLVKLLVESLVLSHLYNSVCLYGAHHLEVHNQNFATSF